VSSSHEIEEESYSRGKEQEERGFAVGEASSTFSSKQGRSTPDVHGAMAQGPRVVSQRQEVVSSIKAGTSSFSKRSSPTSFATTESLLQKGIMTHLGMPPWFPPLNLFFFLYLFWEKIRLAL
jgi:hypothetical protein